MAAYRRVYDSHHLQADCKEPGSTPEPYLGNRLWATQYLYFLGKGDAKIRILKLTRQGHRLAGWSLVVYDCLVGDKKSVIAQELCDAVSHNLDNTATNSTWKGLHKVQ